MYFLVGGGGGVKAGEKILQSKVQVVRLVVKPELKILAA